MADNKQRELLTTIAVLVVIVVIVTGALVVGKKSPKPTKSISSTATNSETAVTTTPVASISTTALNTPSATQTTGNTSGYKDGNYTATGVYDSPGGQASITISLTLREGVITTTSAEEGPADRESKEYQDDFINGYQKLVIGKAISGLSLSRVSGASLTTRGFNNAITQIRTKAEA